MTSEARDARAESPVRPLGVVVTSELPKESLRRVGDASQTTLARPASFDFCTPQARSASCTASSHASNCPCRRTNAPRTCGASSSPAARSYLR